MPLVWVMRAHRQCVIGALPLLPAQHAPGTGAGVLSILYRDGAVDHHMADALGVLVRVGVRRGVAPRTL